jgi:4-amino-4-deoxy-L-arabinose transferase-like glycosyltransferase
MNKPFRIAASIICLAGVGMSFLYLLNMELRKHTFQGVFAPIHINIEIDEAYADSVSIQTDPENKIFYLNPTTVLPVEGKYIVYTNIPYYDLYTGISLRLLETALDETINSISSVSIFIGNKLCYFSVADLISLREANRALPLDSRGGGEFVLLRLPDVRYERSLVYRTWVNWYGDANAVIKGGVDFFIHPWRYLLSWVFLVCLLIINRTFAGKLYQTALAKIGRGKEVLAFTLVFSLAFILRFNGYARDSASPDELYSVAIAGNPTQSFFRTFGDPGNPPIYFIVARYSSMIFGWSETTLCFVSVILGTFVLIPLYILVRNWAGKRAAFLTIIFMTFSTYMIGFSQELRAYVLEIFLAPVTALLFLRFCQKPGLIRLVVYLIPSILIVNTHYYGVLLISSNFLFYIVHHADKKDLNPGKVFFFLAGNIIIALSLLPFFLYTALAQAVLNPSFNSIIEDVGLQFSPVVAGTVIFIPLYLYLRKTALEKGVFSERLCFLSDYTVFTLLVVFFQAFLISLYRPILRWRYLSLCFPFFLIFLAVAIERLPFLPIAASKNTIAKIYKLLPCFLVFLIILGLYEMSPGGDAPDYYKESRTWISADAAAHPQVKSAMLDNCENYAEYYGLSQLPTYTKNSGYEVLYILDEPLAMTEWQMYDRLRRAEIPAENLLKIWINDEKLIFKIYNPQ